MSSNEQEKCNAEYEQYDALLYIAGIAKDRESTDDPRTLKLFLAGIQRVAEKAMHIHNRVPAAFYEAFERKDNE